MCGLFAGYGKLNANRITVLGSMNEDRGQDSVGVAYLDQGRVAVAKVAERPSVGLNLTLRADVTKAALGGLFIGHTRQATQGAVTSENAHPFMVDGVAFAHNGMIFNDERFGEYAVDSQALIHGIKARDFSKYDGPIALVWIEEGQLKAYRCGNPLYRGRHAGAVYLASEEEQLEAIGCDHIKELTEGMIYTWAAPHRINTEHVGKNKVYAYSGSECGTTTHGTAGRSYGPSWLNELEYDDEDAPLDKDGKREKESFSTWKDDHATQIMCDMCGKHPIMNVETGPYCAQCFRYLARIGVEDWPRA